MCRQQTRAIVGDVDYQADADLDADPLHLSVEAGRLLDDPDIAYQCLQSVNDRIVRCSFPDGSTID